jgi:hypothetical protein
MTFRTDGATVSLLDAQQDIAESFFIDLADGHVTCTDDGLNEWCDQYAANEVVYYSDALAHFAGWVFWSDDGSAAADELESMDALDGVDRYSPTDYVTRFTALALYFQAVWTVNELLNADGFDITDLDD